jgi:hypothetical protein
MLIYADYIMSLSQLNTPIVKNCSFSYAGGARAGHCNIGIYTAASNPLNIKIDNCYFCQYYYGLYKCWQHICP